MINPQKALHANKPRQLKQRTSSVDTRKDFTTQTWTSLLGLVELRELLVTVDNFDIWRRHLAWAIEDGDELRDHFTNRLSSNMVFMSLLLSAELAILFESSNICTEVRDALKQEELGSLHFWIGIVIILSIVLTILSLLSTFTAWKMVSAIHKDNVHCILRSSIGQYAAELPGLFIVSSIYAFLLWVMMFFFVLLPVGYYSFILIFVTVGLFVHTITAFSSFGRVIMHSGAMGSQHIFDASFERNLSPQQLHRHLLTKAKASVGCATSIRRQYGMKIEPIRGPVSEKEWSLRLSDRRRFSSIHMMESSTGSGGEPGVSKHYAMTPSITSSHSTTTSLNPSFDEANIRRSRVKFDLSQPLEAFAPDHKLAEPTVDNEQLFDVVSSEFRSLMERNERAALQEDKQTINSSFTYMGDSREENRRDDTFGNYDEECGELQPGLIQQYGCAVSLTNQDDFAMKKVFESNARTEGFDGIPEPLALPTGILPQYGVPVDDEGCESTNKESANPAAILWCRGGTNQCYHSIGPPTS